MNNTVLRIKALLVAKQIEAYTENGCNITAPKGEVLYRIDYMNAVDEAHPRAREFASMSPFDGHDAAKLLAKEQFSSCVERLSIPVFVFSVKTND